MTYAGALDSPLLIRFLQRLVKDAGREVFLILDNLKVHHRKPVKAWLAEHRDPIEVFHLPSYSPELNPDEYLNCDLKAGAHSGSLGDRGPRLPGTVGNPGTLPGMLWGEVSVAWARKHAPKWLAKVRAE